MNRPTISIVLPFLGNPEEASAALESLRGLRVCDGDQLIVADNTPSRLVAALAGEGVTVADASDKRSASHARNVGAALATGEWLLFVDADCEFPPDLLDRHASGPLEPDCGVVAGEIVGLPEQDVLLARWARSRRGLWVSHHQGTGPYAAGVTANMMVRRTAFEEAGGFRIGGGGDLDLSWRLQAAGWRLAYRPEVVVGHRDRESLRGLASQAFSYGSHQSRLRKLHGPEVERPKLLAPLVRALGGAIVWVGRGRWEAATFKLLDGLWTGLFWLGDRTGGPGARRAD